MFCSTKRVGCCRCCCCCCVVLPATATSVCVPGRLTCAPRKRPPPLPAIGSYYAQYLSGYYLNKTREEAKRVDPHLDDYLRKQLIGIVDTLKLLDPNNLATARLEVGTCAPACGALGQVALSLTDPIGLCCSVCGSRGRIRGG